jgi:hypothetical protein
MHVVVRYDQHTTERRSSFTLLLLFPTIRAKRTLKGAVTHSTIQYNGVYSPSFSRRGPWFHIDFTNIFQR